MVNGDGVYTTVGYTVAAAGYPPNYSPPGLPNTGSDIGVIALGGLALVAMGWRRCLRHQASEQGDHRITAPERRRAVGVLRTFSTPTARSAQCP